MSPEAASTIDIVLRFLAALIIPVGIAAPIIALVIDLFLKKISWWKPQHTVRANVLLNLLISGIFFFANLFGMADQFQESVRILGEILPLIALILYGTLGGTLATWGYHKGYQTTGVSKSSTNGSPGLL